MTSLVDAVWLKKQIEGGNTDLVVVDGTWHMPFWHRDPIEEHKSCRIKGAVYFDQTECKNKAIPIPFMLPPTDVFEEYIGKLGISNETHVVIYDNNDIFGMFSAARAWFVFHCMGHKKLSLLDGGLPKWKEIGGPTESGPFKETKAVSYKASMRPELVRNFEQMVENWSSKKEQVVDARSAGRFTGTDPEPNPKIPSGHMVGAVNLPFVKFIKPDTKTLKEPALLLEEFKKLGLDFSRPVVTMCGSGMTACWIPFVANLCGEREVALYDGSWFEWQSKGSEEAKILGVKGEDLKK